jgi:hypothetical protein
VPLRDLLYQPWSEKLLIKFTQKSFFRQPNFDEKAQILGGGPRTIHHRSLFMKIAQKDFPHPTLRGGV